MIQRILGTISCLVIVTVAYSVYALTAAPIIEPAYVTRATSTERSEFYWETAPSQNRQKLKSLFKEDAWQLDSPKVVEWPRGILLFQEYEQIDDELIIKPCTCVIFQDGKKNGRLITMHAPHGAVIAQETLSANPHQQQEFSGRFIGDVVIHSAESAAGANDAIQFITRNVQFEKNRIWTTHDVDFKYAGHRGKGRDLIITLGEQEKSRSQSEPPNLLSRLDSIELIHLDELVLQVEKQILPTVALTASKAGAPAEKQDPSTEMVIRCNGPFRIDAANYRISLEEQVQVAFREEGRVDDTMICDQLQVTFTPPYSSEPDSNNPLLKMTSRFNPQSVIADGNPVLIQSQSRNLMIKGQRVSIDLEKLKFSIKDAVESVIEFEEFAIKVPKLEYTFADDPGRLGTYLAEGPGELRMKPTAENPAAEEFLVQWKAHSTLTVNENQEKLLELNKDARIQLSNTESIACDRLHIWLEETEIPQKDDEASPKYEVSPYKMAATGHVEIELPELHAVAQQAHMWITRDKDADQKITSVTDRVINSRDATDQNDSPQDTSPPARYFVKGESLKLDLRQTADGFQIHGAMMEGDLSFHQEPLPGQSRSSLVLHGERIRMTRGLTGLAELKIDGKERQGQPAWITYKGFQLSGNSIQLNQQMNLVWIQGQGELVYLAPEDPNPANAKRITWSEQMAFTGSKIQLIGNVQSRFRFPLANEEIQEIDLSCNVLELHLNQRLSFQDPQLDQPLDIRELKAVNNVDLWRRIIDKNKQHKSQQKVRVEHVSYFPLESRIAVFGQGSIRHTAINDGKQSFFGTSPQSNENELRCVSVEFNEGLTGKLAKLNLTFRGKVQALTSTVPRWDSQLTSESVRQSQGAELNCDALSVADISQTKENSYVLSATGNTYIYQADYTALAHRISYSQQKNHIVMEGGRGEAKLWLNTNKTPTPNAAARKIIYDLKSGKVDVHSPSFLDSGRSPDLSGQR